MEKRINIEGMSCNHCTARVQQALERIEGVTATLDLTGADVSLTKDIQDAALIRQVTEAGYKVTSIV